MQMIFFLLLPFIAFAQEKCDPVAAEKECYSLTCKTTEKKLVPVDSDELAKAFKNHPYEFPPLFREELDKVGEVAESIRTYTRKKLNDNAIDGFVNEIVTKPFDLLPHLKNFMGGELKCIQKNLECDLVSNDLSQYSEGMKTFYKTLYNKSLIINESTTLTMDQKKILLLKAVGDNKSEQKKIKKLKNESEFMVYSMSAPWIPAYKEKVVQELKAYTKDVTEAIKARAEDFMKYDLVSEGRIAYVKRTCQLGAFIQDTINKNGSVEKFNDYRTKIIDSFKTKFLPRLSAESAQKMSAAISPDIFVLMENNTNIYPPKFSSNHNNGYKEPVNAAQFMGDLALLQRGDGFKCNPGGKLVNDHFQANEGKIYISKYVLANSMPDIMTHEMGHWLTSQIIQDKLSSHSKKKLLKARECVSNFYETEKGKSKYALKLKNDRFHTEEDFADWFSAIAGIGESGLYCDLKKMVHGSDVKNYLPSEGDSHSNYLFRDLSIRLNRGEVLPQSCKDLIGVYPESQPKKCDL